jgi:hypothetical protein
MAMQPPRAFEKTTQMGGSRMKKMVYILQSLGQSAVPESIYENVHRTAKRFLYIIFFGGIKNG